MVGTTALFKDINTSLVQGYQHFNTNANNQGKTPVPPINN
jgi:hypothetical protein